MPSFWSWLPSKKHRLSKSKKSDYPGHGDPKPRKHFYFGRNDKEDSKSRYLPFEGQRNSLLVETSELPDVSPRRKEAVEVESKDEGRKLEGLIQNYGVPKRRLLAYEIFHDSQKSASDVDRQIIKSEPRSNLDQPPLYSQREHDSSHHQRQIMNYEPRSYVNFPPPYSRREHDSPQHHREVINSITPSDPSQSSRYNQREHGSSQQSDKYKDGLFKNGIEQRSSNNVNGFPYRMQRHSLQIGHSGYGKEIIKIPNFRKSETMAGYVPRAVSLHDTSAILYGGEKEDAMPTRHTNLMLEQFSKTYEWVHKVSETKQNLNSRSANHEHYQPSSKDRSAHNKNNYSKNVRRPSAVGRQFTKVPAPRPHKPSHRVSNNVSSSNANFYFSSSMLSPVLQMPRGTESTDRENLSSLSSDEKVPKTSAESSVSTKHTVNELAENSSYNRKDTSSSSDNTEPSSANLWLRKSSSSSSQDYDANTQNSRTNNDEDSDGDSASILDNLDDVPVENSARSVIERLEGILNAEGEVFY